MVHPLTGITLRLLGMLLLHMHFLQGKADILIAKGYMAGDKDGSWNSMISAHINRQMFANIGMCPYCSMGEEGTQHSLYVRKEPYFLIVNPFQLKSCIKKWANKPHTVTRPYIGWYRS